MEDNHFEEVEDIDEIFFDEFDPENLVCEEPEKKTPKDKGGREYIIVKLGYRYPSGSGHIKKPFKVIGCEMSSDQGVQSKETSYGNEYSILSRINHTTTEGKGFYDFSRTLDKCVAEFYKANWKVCGVGKDFDPDRPGTSVTKLLYVKSGDEDSYQPSTYLKFFYYPKSGYMTKILIPPEFEGGKAKELEWNEAKNCRMKFIPCINYHRCNNAGNGGFKIQNLCVSIVITAIEKNASLISQKRTMQMIGTTRAQQIAAQVASLKKQEQQSHIPLDDGSNQDDQETQSTFADLASNNEEVTDEIENTNADESQNSEMEEIKPSIVRVPSVSSAKNSSIKNLVAGVKPRE